MLFNERVSMRLVEYNKCVQFVPHCCFFVVVVAVIVHFVETSFLTLIQKLFCLWNFQKTMLQYNIHILTDLAFGWRTQYAKQEGKSYSVNEHAHTSSETAQLSLQEHFMLASICWMRRKEPCVTQWHCTWEQWRSQKVYIRWWWRNWIDDVTNGRMCEDCVMSRVKKLSANATINRMGDGGFVKNDRIRKSPDSMEPRYKYLNRLCNLVRHLLHFIIHQIKISDGFMLCRFSSHFLSPLIKEQMPFSRGNAEAEDIKLFSYPLCWNCVYFLCVAMATSNAKRYDWIKVPNADRILYRQIQMYSWPYWRTATTTSDST